MPSIDIPPDLVGQSGLYNSPDPLIRRLRLEDPSGKSITNISKYFAEKEVLILYAGSEYGENNIRGFHRDLSTLAQRYKSASVIYVSTDVLPRQADNVLQGKSWLRMTFFDNSDFAPVGEPEKDWSVGMEEVKRGEEFLQAGEIEMGVEKIQFDQEENENDYVRPLSRAGLTVLMNVFSTPSVAVYHLPTHTFLAKNVSISSFKPEQIDKNYKIWRGGETTSVKIADIIEKMKWTLLLLLLAVIYHLAVRFGGKEYDFIPKIMNGINGRLNGKI
ncbi:uncharacterized protein I303_106691 [Kwoniella dejecticola CBS 10117]|uniref:Thioredoxin-like fold domain-containing protein n=1 Tax=Kwoniella dejecticola CBS 10117 TaxID=1296121 RepID=A0A1A5ZTZ2_9TREE|nr:uncharacterized protein I303_08667 [Kwoniella dejecticola CBS 10117]OBR81281.1 hypothetical protein I303_08667 [Kwoniella dejecticola CBS 10117]